MPGQIHDAGDQSRVDRDECSAEPGRLKHGGWDGQQEADQQDQSADDELAGHAGHNRLRAEQQLVPQHDAYERLQDDVSRARHSTPAGVVSLSFCRWFFG